MDVKTRYTQYTQEDAEAAVVAGSTYESMYRETMLTEPEQPRVATVVDIARSWVDEHGKIQGDTVDDARSYFRTRFLELWGKV